MFVTNDGRIEMLDFGLAKLTEAAVAGTGATMATRPAETSPAVVMGTIGYMSPEQVRGQAVDHRSDIFSFGSVLYEMVSGVRAFTGDTAADTMSAILGRIPPELTLRTRQYLLRPGADRSTLSGETARTALSVRDRYSFALENVTVTTEWPAPTGPATDRRVQRTAPLVLTATIGAALIGAAGCGGLPDVPRHRQPIRCRW